MFLYGFMEGEISDGVNRHQTHHKICMSKSWLETITLICIYLSMQKKNFEKYKGKPKKAT